MTNTIITCFRDEAQYKEVLEKLERMGMKWNNRDILTEITHWYDYTQEIGLCIEDNKLTYSALSWLGKYEGCRGYDFITAKYFLENENYRENKVVKVKLSGGEIVSGELVE